MKRFYVLAGTATIIAAGLSACGNSKQASIDEQVEEQLEQSAITVISNATNDTTINIGGRQQPFVTVERIFHADTTDGFFLSVRAIVPARKSGITANVSDIITDSYMETVTSGAELPAAADNVTALENAIQSIGDSFIDYVKPLAQDTVTHGFMMNYDIRPVCGTDKYVTYAVYIDSYTGGAHGNLSTYYETMSIPAGTPYNYDNIIKNKAARTSVRQTLLQTIADSKGQTVDEYLTSVKDFTGDDGITVENFPVYHVAILPEGLVFSYPKYSIAAGFEGCPTYVIPLDDVAGYLAL